jgi:hypothetical protein
MKDKLHSSSSLTGCEWSASCSDHFLAKKGAVYKNRTVNWVGPETGQAVVANRKALEHAFNKLLITNLINMLKHCTGIRQEENYLIRNMSRCCVPWKNT